MQIKIRKFDLIKGTITEKNILPLAYLNVSFKIFKTLG